MSLANQLPTTVNCPLCHDMAKRRGQVFECTSCGIRLRATRIRAWLKWLGVWGADDESDNDGGER